MRSACWFEEAGGTVHNMKLINFCFAAVPTLRRTPFAAAATRVTGCAMLCCVQLVWLTAGCGQPVPTDLTEFSDLHPVTGRVTFQGQPLVGGSVRLFPVTPPAGDAAGDVYSCVVAEDGTFELNTFRAAGRGVGVPAGEFGVSFSWSGHPDDNADLSSDDVPEKLPIKLTRPKTSGVRVTVPPGGTVVPDIDLK